MAGILRRIETRRLGTKARGVSEHDRSSGRKLRIGYGDSVGSETLRELNEISPESQGDGRRWRQQGLASAKGSFTATQLRTGVMKWIKPRRNGNTFGP